ncbi:unnamed protein product [Heligmosomoides polygyrus]|uniref:START domain-containing protein n=1 Tax=Heligmosomoides polygyrus TaxID=6339 RepID=A0A183G8J3_HELPZ|nr:unnamed protein product [Heligmosomoides polygyrus]
MFQTENSGGASRMAWRVSHLARDEKKTNVWMLQPILPEAPQDRQSGTREYAPAHHKVMVTGTDVTLMTLIEEISKRRNLWDIASAAYKDKQRSEMD